MWYTCLGALLTMGIAVLWHFIFGGNDPKTIDHSLLSPCIRKYFQSEDNHLQTKVSSLNLSNSINANLPPSPRQNLQIDIPLKNKSVDEEVAL